MKKISYLIALMLLVAALPRTVNAAIINWDVSFYVYDVTWDSQWGTVDELLGSTYIVSFAADDTNATTFNPGDTFFNTGVIGQLDVSGWVVFSHSFVFDPLSASFDKNPAITPQIFIAVGPEISFSILNTWDGANGYAPDAHITYEITPALEPDRDNDSILNEEDNCPDTPNPEQSDFDSDGIGDVCDADADGDGFDYAIDDCDDTNPFINPDACDIKRDGIDQDCDGFDRIKGKPCKIDESPIETEGKGKTCSDGIDNDGDGYIDCDDFDCYKKKQCR